MASVADAEQLITPLPSPLKLSEFCPTISIVKFKFVGIISSIIVAEFSPPVTDYSLEHEVVRKRISVTKQNMFKF